MQVQKRRSLILPPREHRPADLPYLTNLINLMNLMNLKT